jgi:hypothetical protein
MSVDTWKLTVALQKFAPFVRPPLRSKTACYDLTCANTRAIACFCRNEGLGYLRQTPRQAFICETWHQSGTKTWRLKGLSDMAMG